MKVRDREGKFPKRRIRFRFNDHSWTTYTNGRGEPISRTVARCMAKHLGCDVELWPIRTDDAVEVCEARFFRDEVFRREYVVISKL